MPKLADLPSSERVNALPAPVEQQLLDIIAAYLDNVFPALALTVVHNGEIWLNDAWGWIDPDTRALPVKPDSLFDLASVSKMFTTTALLTLVSQGAVRLDDPLVSVVPEFGQSGPRPMDGGQDPHSKIHFPIPDEVRGKTVDPVRVTFRHLLAHKSGLAPWRDVYQEAGPAPTPPTQPDPHSRQERWAKGLQAICRYPFVGEPGDHVRYSDLGMMLLGEATSRLHGLAGDLETAVRARVFAPLGLEAVTYNPVRNGRPQTATVPTENDPVWRKRRPWGEVHDENSCGLGGVTGHAGLFSAARDVAALGQAWLDNDRRLGIAPELMDEARREQARIGDESRGLGWQLNTPQNILGGSLRSYIHTGFTGTSLWIDPARELVVACLTNRVYYGREKVGVEDFRHALHGLFAGAIN